MLVFIDESGDTGLKTTTGSSQYFTISSVLFDNHEEAISCDQRVTLLKKELKLPEHYEFHFAHNSNKIRHAFLTAINPYHFLYICIAINKDFANLYSSEFNSKESFYQYACQMLFINAQPYLHNTVVIIDKSGNPDFRSRLAKYLKNKLNTNDKSVIKKIKQQNSHSNNLLQLADYVSGIINRKLLNKPDWQEYYQYIRSKEIITQILPK